MKLNEDLQNKLRKTFAPASVINMRYKGNDIAFKTDDEGNPVLLFVGKLDENGNIKGERFVRTLKHDAKGQVFKDHWELKGKAS